jgi:uncharacterized protein (DUF1800 family)
VHELKVEPSGMDAGTSNVAAAAAALSALTLAACGDVGSSSAAPPISADPQVPPPAAASVAPPAIASVTTLASAAPTGLEAARFLLQAQLSITDTDLAAVKSSGYSVWLTSQYNAARGQTGVAWLDSHHYDAITIEKKYFAPQFGDFMIWNQLLAGPDQMRKRMALALSEFFVVSLNGISGYFPPYVIAAYWDLLCANCFGNFRTLLEQITLNAGMGFYLNTKGNLKEDSNGRQPDENFAREVMQLFTIGLYELNPDGSLRLDASNNPIETYSQSDITSLAHVFTGYDLDYTSNGGTWTPVTWANYPIPSRHFATNPMKFTAGNHSTLSATFLGTTIPVNTPGAEALRIALDRLFAHPNTGPFFARQMIQRLVTSNPSTAYVRRVAAAFANNGAGVRGDLKAVWTAILTDAEARTLPGGGDTLSGKLREPLLRWVQWARTVGISSASGMYEIYDLSSADGGLGQSPLRASSVFNFFRPGYVPPNTAIAAAGKQAPEFQLLNETSTAGYINFLQRTTRVGYNDVKPSYAYLITIAHDTGAVLAWLNLRMSANQLLSGTLNTVKAVMNSYKVTASSADSTKLDMLATACMLIMASPEYLVQK